ncbi:MAG TPA: DUF6152 family protein [Gammaproteobacteria bacterium]|nr:DUF6152 family protein [Gammaproteobacteria bacterium]
MSHARAHGLRVARALAVAWLAAGAGTAFAHHELAAKFDTAKTTTLEGVVTAVDWRNPHAHVFFNVKDKSGTVANWAAELDNTIVLEKSGWSASTLRAGDPISVRGHPARDGTRQISGDTVTRSGSRVLFVKDTAPVPPKTPRATPRGADGHPLLGGPDGYWGYPSATALVQQGASVRMDAEGLLANIADAPKVAPFQPWALGVYTHRQERQLRDDPMYLNCKPPGGVRYLQSPLGFQLIEDHVRQRIFVLFGSGNHNYRIVYLDGRKNVGQVRGDDDNPLYYGRGVGTWDGDTLVVETTGFNEDFWFTNGGLPHTNLLSLTERFSRPNFDTLHYEVTVNDPGAYTQPWKASWDLRWVDGQELPVFFCQENRS